MNDELLKLDNQLCFSFYSISMSITRMYGPLLTELGITYPQYLVLLILWENDNVEVNKITMLLRMDTGTVSPMLKRLEANGFITRKRSQNDERKVMVSLTKKGSALKIKAAGVPSELFCKAGLNLTEYKSLKKTLSDFLLKIENNAS